MMEKTSEKAESKRDRNIRSNLFISLRILEHSICLEGERLSGSFKEYTVLFLLLRGEVVPKYFPYPDSVHINCDSGSDRPLFLRPTPALFQTQHPLISAEYCLPHHFV